QGVLLEGLGTFCTVQEPLHLGEEGVLLVRRPIFKLGVHMVWPRGFTCPEVTLPDNIKIEPLNYCLLSLFISFPRNIIQGCVEETIRLFSFHLEKKHDVAFVFTDIGVLSYQENTVCMMFYASCIKHLEKRASLIAALRS
ncbi:CCD81 protein, partial [Nothoprocta ornata]|nr:CCD81 protein [Nothoprocta pentlandii]NWY07767.1 CCD81 protein [Nothoprocta ornata]